MSIHFNGKLPMNVTFEAWFYPSGVVAFYDSNGNSLGASKWKELPPHGDLIDRNHLEVVSYHNSEGMEDTFDNGVKWMLEYIDKLTPVIPEHEEKTP